MRRVLIVAYYFPPLGGMGSIRVTGFATHLPAYGWEPVVLAPRTGAYHRDPELRFPEERVVRTRSFELSRAAKRVLQTGKIIQLEPMPAIERRIVHMALVENPQVRTQSVGVEPNRRIVILPATKVE